MISVGNRDGRKKVLELGFGSREDMRGSEVEEGEAGFIDLNDDDENNSSTIDPDVALSYIDEKLQDVLGHFQKDFEGGVSAENLGAKFGGYGSFLPSYQRSPSWSHPRTPTEYNHYGSRSIDNGQLQNGQTNSLYSSPDIISSNSVTRLRPASRNNDQRNPLPNHGKELTSKSELPNSTNLSDQKSWKVRIKVGKDDLKSQKYADIYSGLGLDVSPSSSLNESPLESEGLHYDLPDIPDESLSRILQIMTSATLSGRLLLSPLSDELICLTENEWITGESEPKIVDTANQVRSRTAADGSDFKMTEREIGNKPIDSVSPTYNHKYISHATSVVPKKETGLDIRSYDKLISSTMKLPLLSDADGAGFKKNSVKTKTESKVSARSQVKSDAFSDVGEKKVPEPSASIQNGRANQNTKKSSKSGKVVVSRKAKSSSENSGSRKREVNCTDEEDELAMKNGEHVGQDISVRADTVHTPPQTVIEKILDYGEDSLELHPGETLLSSAHENRAIGDHNIVAQDVMYPEDGILNNSLKSHQSKASISDSEDLTRSLVNTVDEYKECIGDLELARDKNNIESEEMLSIQTGKGSGVLEMRNIDKPLNISKEKSMGKKSVDLSPLDRRDLASNVSHHAGKGPNPDSSATAEAPLLNEDWVQCDKCHKWRILPLGTNPTSLPENWVCSMLDWLPGMNHCDISQDDTTHALRAAQASTSGSNRSQLPISSENIPVVSSGDAQGSTDDHQRSGLIGTIEVKKNHVIKDVAKGTNQENSPFVRNSNKRLPESTKTRSLNDIDNSPSINDFGYHHDGQTSSLLEGRHCEENQNIPLQNHSDKDDTLKSKRKDKKDNEVDEKRASKKIKMGDPHPKDENYTSDSRLSNIPSGKGRHENNRFRISKGGIKNLSGSSERPEVLNSVSSDDGSQHLAVHRLDDNMKEGKVNDALKSDGNDMHLPGAENRSSRSRGMSTERHETDERIPKKARVSKSEGKDRKRQSDHSGSAKKVSRGTKDIFGHDLVGTASQRGTDAVEPLRKDLGLMQPSVAATSSSSKVSSSLRNKAGLNEMKDSPIESVSSSPLRASGVGHFGHTRRDVTTNHDFQDVGFFPRASPVISSHDEPIFDTDQTGKIRSDDNMHHLESVQNMTETSQDLNTCNVSSPDKGMQNARQIETLRQNHNEKSERERSVSRHSGHSKKAGKGYSSRSKDKKQVSRSVCENDKANHFDPVDVPLYEEKSMAGGNKSQGMLSVSCDRTDKSHVSKKDSAVDCKEEIPMKVGVRDGTGASGDAIPCQDVKQKVLHNSETARSSKSLYSDKTITGVSERGKSNTKPPSVRGQSESTTNLQPIVELKKENGSSNDNDEQSKSLKQPKRPEKPNVNQQASTRNSSSSIHKGRAAGESKDSSSQAVTNAVKEAKDLKHMADRLKNSGSTESTGLYFQAALKFLHGACLLESCSNENGKQTKIQSMEMYSSTAKLCEFCAHEYEKSKDMAAAALAYKCVEVAYMRVIYTSHAGVNKVRNEVQTALQLVPTGDSPSSSASDIDNLNNAAIVDKAIASSKGVGSPQATGAQVLTARNRSSCLHLIRFAQEVTFAMEASRKSRSRLGEVQNKEGISSVKRALDFNFQDVDGLLQLVRVAMEAINR